MTTRLLRMSLAAAGLFFAVPALYAEEDAALSKKRLQIIQEIVDGTGVSLKDVGEAVTPGGPPCTLGQRFESMLESGTITQGQYDKIYQRIAALPQDKIQAIKGTYDLGQGAEVQEGMHDLWHRKSNPPSGEGEGPGNPSEPPGEGIEEEVLADLLGGPVDSLGSRLETMLKNGTVTQAQYDLLVKRLSELGPGKVASIKNAYDAGNRDKAYEALTGVGYAPSSPRPERSGPGATFDEGAERPAPRDRREERRERKRRDE